MKARSTWTLEEVLSVLESGGGFTADNCGKCRIKANIRAGGPGWWCPCGHWNLQDWSGNSVIPYDSPDFGPTRELFDAAHSIRTVVKPVMEA